MKKVKEEMLEKLRGVKEIAQNDLKHKKGYEKYEVKNVTHYNKKVDLVNKETGEKEEFDLCVALAVDPDSNQILEIYYLNGEEADIEEILMKYESPQPIRDLINDTKENEEKPEDEKDEELRKEELEELEELEAEEKKEKYAELLNEDKEKIKAIAELQQVEKEEKDKEKIEKMSHLQEIDANTKVNAYKDMEKTLGLNGVEKFVIVYSEDAAQLSDKGEKNSSRYSMIAIMDDGSMLNLNDRLEEVKSEGKNSTEGRIQTDANEETHIENNPASMYKIKGSSLNEAFSFENGEYGEIKAYYGNMTKEEGTKFVGTQLATNNVYPTSRDLRDTVSDREGIYHADEKYNNFAEQDWKELATKWGYYKDCKPDEEKAKKMFEKYRENNPDLSPEDVIQKVSDDLYDQIPGRIRN